MLDDAISILGSGTTVTTGAASARVALPTSRDGYNARYVRVQADGYAYIKFGNSTVVATTSDVMVNANTSEIFNILGCTHVAYLQVAAAQKVNVTPLENA